MRYALAILALVVLCGLWVLFQQWVAKRMPEAPGIGRRCDGCSREHCEHHGTPQRCPERDA